MKFIQIVLIASGFGFQVQPATIHDYFNALGYSLTYDHYFNNLVSYSSSFGERTRRNIYKYPKWKQGAKGKTKKTKTRHQHGQRRNRVSSMVPMFSNGRQKYTSLKSSCLYAHNKLRGIHGVPGVSWDSSLAASARRWASHVADRGYLYHSPGCLSGKYGENLAYRSLSFKGIWSPAYLIFNLYSELWDPGYNYNYPDYNRGTGHFTQVVWRNTRKIGCGIATRTYNRAGRLTYLVCQYYPKGNTVGQFGRNVPRPLGGRSLPSSGKSLAVEGCSDYSAYCSNLKKSCSYQKEVREACCDSCKWSFNG